MGAICKTGEDSSNCIVRVVGSALVEDEEVGLAHDVSTCLLTLYVSRKQLKARLSGSYIALRLICYRTMRDATDEVPYVISIS